MKKITKNLILIIIGVIVGGLIVGGTCLYKEKLGNKSKENLSIEEVAERALNFLNQNLLKGKEKASLIGSVEKNGLYKIRFKLRENEFDFYASKDGKLLFPRMLDLETPPIKELPKSEVPEVKLFVMAFCPFGNQAEELIMPLAELFGEKIDLKLHYVFYSNYEGGGEKYCIDKENKYCSMHGIQELHQGIRELCVQKYQKEKLWSFVKEINKQCSSQDADSCWEEIAKNQGINVQAIKNCQEKEALDLLEKERKLTQKEYQVQDVLMHRNKDSENILGSPVLVINDMIFDGERSIEGYKEGICSSFKNPPKECE